MPGWSFLSQWNTERTFDRACYSLGLFRPFLKVLQQSDAGRRFEDTPAFDPDDRIPIRIAHEYLEEAVRLTGDPDLGLKAARELRLGDAGAIDYLVHSAETVEEAVRVAARYMRLVNDALHVRLRTEGERTTIQLHSSIDLPRAAVDFHVGSIFWAHLRRWLKDSLSDVRLFFPHPRPVDTREYETTFAPASVCFGAPLSGYSFDAYLLRAPLAKADPSLHYVLRKHADAVLAKLPKVQSVSQQVCEILTAELGRGTPTARYVAKRLGMSVSTMGRRLEKEGGTFKDLLDDVRKRLAAEYLMNPELELAEVALLLGFAQSSAFHRAFRRWTAQTPAEFRRRSAQL